MEETRVRRWNGWADEGVEVELPPTAALLLDQLVGPASPPRDAELAEVAAGVSASRLAAHPLLSTDAVDRIRHATGQSLPDWVAMRSGRYRAVPDAVGRPATSEQVRELLDFGVANGATVIPYGGGTSVVGGVSPVDPTRPSLTVSLEMLAGLHRLDERSGLATFGAGTTGPALEAALAPSGLTLGHSPQSFYRSTVGGWVVTRSAGHQSIGVGRMEALFAGGRLEAPSGTLELPPHPASAAGPDLRQLVLGSEGRFGILTEVTVRAMPAPETDVARSWFVADWDRGLDTARALARAALPLSVVRVSSPAETATLVALAGRSPLAGAAGAYFRARGIGPEPALLIVAARGRRRVVRATLGEAASIVNRAGGVGTVADLGGRWIRNRFRSAALRDTLWSRGYAVDTLETAVDWTALAALASAIEAALSGTLAPDGERVHVFSHLSHVYPSGSSLYTTFAFRLAPDPDETLARWRRLKDAASRAIVEHGATISHQHGVGRDHAELLVHEKGRLGMDMLEAVRARLDPARIMNPGVLLADPASNVANAAEGAP